MLVLRFLQCFALLGQHRFGAAVEFGSQFQLLPQFAYLMLQLQQIGLGSLPVRCFRLMVLRDFLQLGTDLFTALRQPLRLLGQAQRLHLQVMMLLLGVTGRLAHDVERRFMLLDVVFGCGHFRLETFQPLLLSTDCRLQLLDFALPR